ncbi:MAG: site-2 protease family protein [Gammaproteobacteria bacterium]
MENYATLIAVLFPAVFAITVHEVAHGWVANRCGDSTALNQGRLSLNPLKHVDPVGTVLVPALLYLSSQMLGTPPFFFGWAKPVPINWRNLRRPRRDIALVAGAGPGANLLMLMAWLACFHLIKNTGIASGLLYMCFVGIMFNATIMLINLIPIPPLDGSRIVSSALPAKAAYMYNRIEPFGLLVLAALLFSNVLGSLLNPMLRLVQHLI